MTLNEILTATGGIDQILLKKSFMPYTKSIAVDGDEKTAIAILLNLSSPKPSCDDWNDTIRAQKYFDCRENIKAVIAETQWIHTHNLKYPDCRVQQACIVAIPESEYSKKTIFGWSHNGARYRHSIWLLSRFLWQDKETSLLHLICEKNAFWLNLLNEFGLQDPDIDLLHTKLIQQTQNSVFPDQLSPFSKQVQFPYFDDYLAITPVVNHGWQIELEQRARNKNKALPFARLTLPNSASIGNLCASVGGTMSLLYYPVAVSKNSKHTLVVSRAKSAKYFDNSLLYERRFQSVLAHLSGFEPLTTRRKQAYVRKHQIKYLREQIARWLLPLIELKDCLDTEINSVVDDKQELWVQDFLQAKPHELIRFKKPLSLQLHQALAKNKVTKKFAYHPAVIGIIDIQLKVILRWLGRSIAVDTSSHSESQYIHLSSMRVFDLCATPCPYLVGAPSLSAIYGFIHHFERKLKNNAILDKDTCFTGFAFFIHDEKITNTAKLTEPNKVAKKTQLSHAKRPTIRTEYFADLEFDLVIQVTSNMPVELGSEVIKTCLPSHFAGGSLFPPLLEHEIEWLQIIKDKFSLHYQIKSLSRSGAWLFPTDKMITGIDTIEKYLAEDNELIPVSNGFHFIEQPKQRKGSIAAKHVYAENSLLMAKRVNSLTLRFLPQQYFFANAFWQYQQKKNSLTLGKYQD